MPAVTVLVTYRRQTSFVELFSWKDAKASDAAHRTPEVMAIWGPMEPLLESMEIAVVEELPQGS